MIKSADFIVRLSSNLDSKNQCLVRFVMYGLIARGEYPAGTVVIKRYFTNLTKTKLIL